MASGFINRLDGSNQGRVAATILKQFESLGYVVKIFRVNDVIEMHVVPWPATLPTKRPSQSRCVSKK
jgi:hypothetical protein